MSTDPTGAPGAPPAGAGGAAQGPANTAPGTAGGEQPSEEELRRAYEAELSRVSVTDMMAQAAVSLLNLGARRLQAERDLDQVRDAIDGVRALLAILERTIGPELGPLRDALSQLQMAYAREVQAGGEDEASVAAPQPAGAAGPGDTTATGASRGPGGASGPGGAGGAGDARGPSEPDGEPAGGEGRGEGGSGAPPGGGAGGPGGPAGGEQGPPAGRRPGPAESSGRLWVPGR